MKKKIKEVNKHIVSKALSLSFDEYLGKIRINDEVIEGDNYHTVEVSKPFFKVNEEIITAYFKDLRFGNKAVYWERGRSLVGEGVFIYLYVADII